MGSEGERVGIDRGNNGVGGGYLGGVVGRRGGRVGTDRSTNGGKERG